MEHEKSLARSKLSTNALLKLVSVPVGNLSRTDAIGTAVAGFPCQAFSAAGNRDGFADTRGTTFFYVEKIIKEHRPKGFILENVEGLVNHDGGNTLSVILGNLENLGYATSYRVLNSKNFGVPQERKRIYIVGYNFSLCLRYICRMAPADVLVMADTKW